MTFEGQYLTYAEYQDLGGSAIGDKPFDLLEFEARRKIDEYTFNRLKEIDFNDLPQEVKLCDFKLINSIKNYAESTSGVATAGNIKSESIDGYSVSYLSSGEISNVVESMNKEIENIIKSYLLGVIVDGQHIMYCGID